MTDAHAGLILGLTQAALALAIWGDKWVHGISGKKSLEVRMADCEKEIARLHIKASDFQTEQQVKVGQFSERLAAIDEHLRHTDVNVDKLERRREDR